jgi:hypothetical protein
MIMLANTLNTLNEQKRKKDKSCLIMLEELLINLINNKDRMSGGALIYKQLNDYAKKKIVDNFVWQMLRLSITTLFFYVHL